MSNLRFLKFKTVVTFFSNDSKNVGKLLVNLKY